MREPRQSRWWTSPARQREGSATAAWAWTAASRAGSSRIPSPGGNASASDRSRPIRAAPRPGPWTGPGSPSARALRSAVRAERAAGSQGPWRSRSISARPLSEREGARVVMRSPFGGGELTGDWRKGKWAGDSRRSAPTGAGSPRERGVGRGSPRERGLRERGVDGRRRVEVGGEHGAGAGGQGTSRTGLEEHPGRYASTCRSTGGTEAGRTRQSASRAARSSVGP